MLLDLQNIVINKADKGSTIVVQEKDTYLQEGLNHLSNQQVYKMLKTEFTPTLKMDIILLLDHLYRAGMPR